MGSSSIKDGIMEPSMTVPLRLLVLTRIAMSFAVAGLAAAGKTILHDSQCVDISYPAFFTDLEKVLTKTDVY
mgnify:CR=1 FL=1